MMPMGMQTVEFISNSLRDEWTGAWNTVHKMRAAAATEEERDRALKWILWLPHGMLQASSKGGQKGARQYRDLARRFVAWRNRDMRGLLKTWRMTTITAKKRMTKAKARKAKGENARIERVVRLLRKGAISRAGKAFESKGLGDLNDMDADRRQAPEQEAWDPTEGILFPAGGGAPSEA
jgi:hypothetical protein